MAGLHPRYLFGLCLLLLALSSRQALAGDAREELRALHEKVLRAHRESNVELLLEDEAEDYVVASRGEVTRPTLAERRGFLGPYLRATTFTEYKDLTDPIVTTSADGTLGWVVVQVRARGTQTGEAGEKRPLEFVSAWIELYQKRNGKWYRTGNVSSFRP